MTIKFGTRATRSLLAAGLALGIASAYARDYNVTHEQEQLVQPGMTADALKAALGSPAGTQAVANEPAPIWIYHVANSPTAVPESRTVFDVHFGADGRVTSASESVMIPVSDGD
jgi:SmpA / OmlA family